MLKQSGPWSASGLGLLALLLAGCAGPGGGVGPSVTPPPPAAVAPATPTPRAAPDPGPELAPPPTRATPTVRVTGSVVNLRAGPGLDHAVLGQVRQSEKLRVTGISADHQWLRVEPEHGIRWIYADLTDIQPGARVMLMALGGATGTVELTAPACPAAGPSPNLACDRELLLEMRDRLRRPDFDATLSSWQRDTPLEHFVGVQVGGDPPRVIHLRLRNRFMVGLLPPALGRLTGLRRLDFQESRLTGPLPPALGQLTQLQYLDLQANQLTGSIPSQLGQLTQLRELLLFGNQLTGPIPPPLGQLTELRILDLAQNQLTGPIPAELGQLTPLRELLLFGNQLTGPIPPSLGQLTELRILALAQNQLTGPIPPELGQLSHLLSLHLADNQLTGPIPPALDQLLWLQFLQLAPNPLSGCLPLVVQAKCDACPELPLCPLPSIPEGGATACPEAGPSPSLACDKEILLALRDTLRGSNHEVLDNWRPETPVEYFAGIWVRGDPPRVVAVRLGGHGRGEPNPLAGTIPPALARLPWLEQLSLTDHRLMGPIPLELGQLARLRQLNLAGNRLVGPIPPTLCQLSQLKYLNLSRNALERRLSAVWTGPQVQGRAWNYPSLPFCPD